MSTFDRTTRIGAYVLLVRDERILLCHLREPTVSGMRWTLPGGGLDFGEHPEAGAIREAKEETGFDVTLGALVGVESYHGPTSGGELHHVCLLYRAEIVGGDLTPEEEGSTDEVRWVSPEEAAGLPLVMLAQAGLRHAFPNASG